MTSSSVAWSNLRALPRLAKRYGKLVGQLGRDLAWHRRFSGEAFPPLLSRIAEQARLLRSNAIDGEDYYTQELYRASMPYSDKITYLGWYESSRYFDTLNPRVYDVLARDKALFHCLAESLRIPTPAVLATTGSGQAPSCGLRLQDRDAVRAFLCSPDMQDLFLKPADGKFGEGALSLGARLGGPTVAWHRLPDGERLDVDQLVDQLHAGGRLRRFLIQRRLRPHPDLAAIVPDVCPSVRVMTYTRERPSIIGAALRLGDGSGPTDNFTGGGLVVAIDEASGVLGPATAIVEGLPRRYTQHPMTTAPISGVVLPFWAQLRDLVKQCAARLSFLPCVGWDIGITDLGPTVIEINTHPRCRLLQIANGKGLLSGPLGDALAKNDGIARSGLHLREHSSSRAD